MIKDYRYKRNNESLVYLLLLIAFILDLIGSRAEILNIILISIALFFAGRKGISFNRKISSLFLIVNVVIFIITFSEKIFLFNIICLALILWSYVTPWILRINKAFLFSVTISFSMVFLGAIYKLPLPLHFIALYPVYLAGVISSEGVAERKGIRETILLCLNIVISIFMLLRLIGFIGEMEELVALLTLNSQMDLGETAVYMSLAIFLVNFLVINISLLLCSSKRVSISRIINESYDFFKRCTFIFLLVLLSELILKGNLIEVKESITHPYVIFNFMFIYSIYFVASSFLGITWGITLVGIISGILFIANIIKLIFLSQPFYPWDIYMLEDALIVSPQYINLPMVIGLIIAVGVIGALIFKKRHSIKRRFKISPSLVLIPFALVFLIGMVSALEKEEVARSAGISESLRVSKEELISNGFFAQNYYYFTDMDSYISRKPENYESETIKEVKNKLLELKAKEEDFYEEEEEKPNVVVIMSETFWDPGVLQGVEYSEDLTENFRKNIAGEIIVPVFGGGTANSEFEALTGLSTYDMAEGIIAYNIYVNRATHSIAEIFKENGYKTTAIHPNTEDFYNRDNAYLYMGFDEFIDIKGFKDAERKGNQVSDNALTDKILSELKSSEEPQFIFAVTIQNHDSYYEKYQEGTDVKVQSTLLDEMDKEILESFAQGVYDADRAYGKLIEGIEKSGKPTIVYYFGDHLPRLGYPKDIYEIYYKTGYLEKGITAENTEELKLFNTQLAKWSSYKELNTFDKPVSAFYLAYDILKEAKVEMPLYFSIYPELIEEYPVLSPKNKKDIKEDSEILKNYKLIQYDILFGNRYILEE
ncbi:LTA synthase family protein [Alloiococcus sp. CFN-8]|uniref:LTA synthase family protein n=1 Tax=Alloiococcus sp. CFN-8 TaxID=3416081 RepID=UPI003CF1F60C